MSGNDQGQRPSAPDDPPPGDDAPAGPSSATGSEPDADRAEQWTRNSDDTSEAEQVRAEGLVILRQYAEKSVGGNIYINAHTLNADSISGRDTGTTKPRRGPSRRGSGAGRGRAGDDSTGPRVVGVSATSVEELARLRAVTVPVGACRQAEPLLVEERLVVLWGPAGAGKRTAAMHLLDSYGPILDIDPSVSVCALADFSTTIRRPDRRCYVVESLSADTARALNDYTVRSLVRQLKDTDSHLILTVDKRVPLATDVRDRVVAWDERPEPLEVLRRHLAYYLTPAMADQVMTALPLQELEHQLAERELRLVNRLAREVAKAYRDGEDLERAIGELGLHARSRAQEWFEQERTPDQVALLLAAAVLSGCPYSKVSAHAGRIEKLLTELCQINLTNTALSPTRARGALLGTAMAVTAEGLLSTEFGTCVTPVVRMESAALAPAVLDVVWNDHDLAAEALVRWLHEAGSDADADVRLRAALAAGQLAEFDFAAVRSRLLLPWAKDASASAGWSAAEALGVPAAKEETAPLALRLLQHWARVSNLQMVWTAIASLSSYVGLHHPVTAMNELLGIAQRQPETLSGAVGDGVRRLFRLGSLEGQDVPSVVLSGLVDWQRPDLDPAPQLARAVYVNLLDAAADPELPDARLIWQRLTAEEARPLSARLLGAAMRDKAARDLVVEVLADLVDLADLTDRADRTDYDDGIGSALEQLVLDSVNGPLAVPRDAQRLRHYLTPWTSGRHPSPTARRLLDRLPKG